MWRHGRVINFVSRDKAKVGEFINMMKSCFNQLRKPGPLIMSSSPLIFNLRCKYGKAISVPYILCIQVPAVSPTTWREPQVRKRDGIMRHSGNDIDDLARSGRTRAYIMCLSRSVTICQDLWRRVRFFPEFTIIAPHPRLLIVRHSFREVSVSLNVDMLFKMRNGISLVKPA